jgi:hypothetical protein
MFRLEAFTDLAGLLHQDHCYFTAASPVARVRRAKDFRPPAPDGPAVIALRMYLPKSEIIDGTWTPPNVEKVK